MDHAAAGAEAVGRSPGDAAAEPAARRSTWPHAALAERVTQGAIAVILAAALGLGLVLTPSPTGTGTHTVLGLPPCGMLVTTGHPCPTCGVTTSFVLAAHGRFHDALVNQPFGLVTFVLVVAGLALSLVTLATGRSWYPLARPLWLTAALMVVVAVALVSWVYKWATM